MTIPDSMAAIMQRTRSSHICANAWTICRPVVNDSSLMTNTEENSLSKSVAFEEQEKSGNVTFTSGTLQPPSSFLTTERKHWCMIFFTVSFHLDCLFLGKNSSFQSNLAQLSFEVIWSFDGQVTLTCETIKKKRKYLHDILVQETTRTFCWFLEAVIFTNQLRQSVYQ